MDLLIDDLQVMTFLSIISYKKVYKSWEYLFKNEITKAMALALTKLVGIIKAAALQRHSNTGSPSPSQPPFFLLQQLQRI